MEARLSGHGLARRRHGVRTSSGSKCPIFLGPASGADVARALASDGSATFSPRPPFLGGPLGHGVQRERELGRHGKEHAGHLDALRGALRGLARPGCAGDGMPVSVGGPSRTGVRSRRKLPLAQLPHGRVPLRRHEVVMRSLRTPSRVRPVPRLPGRGRRGGRRVLSRELDVPSARRNRVLHEGRHDVHVHRALVGLPLKRQ
jgi:hypothetical protein